MAGSRILRGPLPFVGRVAQLQELSECLDAASRGDGRVVLLRGDAGIGKTRVARELMALAEERGVQATYGRCISDGSVPYFPFIEGLVPQLERAGLLRRFPVLAALTEAGGGQRQGYDAPPEAVPGLFLEIPRSVVALSRLRPLLLVVDDLHWADDGSRAAFEHLTLALLDLAERQPVPVCVVGAFRPEQASELAGLIGRLRRAGRVWEIAVTGFDQAETHAYLRSLLGRACAPETVDDLYGAADGNPFLVREIAESIDRRGGFVERRGQAVATIAAIEARIDDDVTGAIREKIDALPRAAFDTLFAASLLDGRFSLEILANLLEAQPDMLVPAIEAGIDAGLLAEAGDGLEFAHPIIRSQFQRTASGVRRRRVHLTIAEAILDGRIVGPVDRAMQAAYHLLAAGGEAPPAILASVAIQAGEDAYRVSAWTEAARYFEAAVAAGTGAPLAMAPVQLRAAQAHYRNLDVERSRERFMDAIEGFRGSDEYMGWAEALVGWIRSQISHGGVPIGTMLDGTLVDEFLAAVGGQSERARARVLAEWAEVLFNAQRPAEAMAMAGEALEIGEATGDDFVSVHATDTMALALYLDLRPADALAYHRRAEAHATRLGDPWVLGWPLQRIPLCLFALGRLDEASAAAERAGELAEAVHDWAENSMNFAVRGALALAEGDFGACERFAARSLLMLDRSNYGWTPGILFPALTQARMMQGQTAAAGDVMDLWRQGGARGPAWLLDQLVQVAAGRSGDVRGEIEQHPQRAFRRDATDAFGLGALAARAQLARDLDLPELSQFSREGLATAYGRGVRFTLGGGVFLVPRLLGELAVLAGDETGAAEYFEAAVRDADACGALPELGQTHLSWARMLNDYRLGSVADFAEKVRHAASIFADTGMRPAWLAAHALAKERGLDLAETLAVSLPDDLDVLDVEILAQRARGKEASDIATATLLGERNVQQRLDMLRGRLGITSALAARDYLDRSGLDPAHYAGAGRASARLGPDRSLRVIMVADIVQSTATNVRLGDEGWVRILDVHDATVRDALARHGGVAVKHTGDGVLATFPSASDALLCASDIVASCPITHPAMPEATLEICVGLSAGEPIVIDDDLRGQAVTEAFRICGHADVREILVSADVVELYRGNAFGFEAHGEFELKGWPAPRRLHRALPVATASVNAFT